MQNNLKIFFLFQRIARITLHYTLYTNSPPWGIRGPFSSDHLPTIVFCLRRGLVSENLQKNSQKCFLPFSPAFADCHSTLYILQPTVSVLGMPRGKEIYTSSEARLLPTIGILHFTFPIN